MSEEFKKDIDPLGNDFEFPLQPERPYLGKVNIFPLFFKGSVLLILGIIGHRCWFFINTSSTEGQVVYFKRVYHSRGGHHDFPVIAFQTKDGMKITFPGGLGTDESGLSIGDRVKVIYKKDQPARAIILSFLGFWYHHVLLCIFLLICWFGFCAVYWGYGD